MANFADDFAGTGALSGNWTQAEGTADRSSGEYRITEGSFGAVTSIYTGTPCAGLTQYAGFSTSSSLSSYPYAVLRAGNSDSPYYVVQFDGGVGAVELYRFADWSADSGDLIDNDTFPQLLLGEAIGVTITGTGASTIVRCWFNPTGTPSSATDWNGDSTPNTTLTNDGTFVVDTGNYVGLGGQAAAANTLLLDDFVGGDAATAGGGGIVRQMQQYNYHRNFRKNKSKIYVPSEYLKLEERAA